MAVRRPRNRRSYLGAAWAGVRGVYSRAVRRYRLLLRAVGLGILAIVHGDEAPKILVYKSRGAVLLRSAVHILPAAVSLILVAFNLHGYFIGRELQGPSDADDVKMGVLQVVAKIQELLILSSVATVIFHLLRSKLTCREGLPLGLLGSDKSFTQVSFFWSLEFWGAVLSFDCRRWRQNAIVVVLLIVGGVFALLAGPAAAVLMIPKEVDWPVGGGIFWLNGSESEMWPTVLDVEYLQGYDCSADEDRLYDFRCPSAGYLPLYSHLSSWSGAPNALYEVPLQDTNMRKVVYVITNDRRWKDTWTYTASAPSANSQDAAGAAISVVRGSRRDYLSARGLVTATGSSISLLPTAPQLLAIPLDIAAGDASSLGLLLLERVGGEDNTTMRSVTCTVDARWAQAKTIIDPSPNGEPLAHDFMREKTRNIVKTELENSDYIKTSLYSFHPEDDGNWRRIRIQPDWFDLLSPSVSSSSLPNQWSEHPGFRPQDSASSDPTLLERLLGLHHLPEVDKDDYATGLLVAGLEVAISMFITDALSRCGAHRHLETWKLFPAWEHGDWATTTEDKARSMVRNGDPVETYPMPQVLEGRDATRMVMRARFKGYALTPTNWFDYISIALVLAHAVIAVAHTAWSLWRGETSEAWDSIPELVALSQQSAPAPPPLMENTCAGIRTMRTMGRVVRVETSAARYTASSARDTLHLTFRESWQERDPDRIPAVTALYGDGPRAWRENGI